MLAARSRIAMWLCHRPDGRAGADAMLDPDEVSALLSKLCIDLGFCLPPEDFARLCQTPPGTVEAFAEAVFAAEQYDPRQTDLRLYRRVRATIQGAFQAHLDRWAGPRGLGS